MDAVDRLVRALYALAVEEEWNRFRSLALERAATELGAAAAAWLTHPADQPHPAEFTAWPQESGAGPALLHALPPRPEAQTLNAAQSPPGTRHGIGTAYAHQETRLLSRVAFWFGGAHRPPPVDALQRLVGHLAEAGALALKHFVLSDERLSRWGRSNRGTAALVDLRGTVHAASRGFRQLVGAEFGDPQFARLPFSLPEEIGAEQSFSGGALRFHAVRADELRLLVYARRAQPLDGLSPREQEIARALAAGKTFKSVARQCGIATSTVANHASRIYRKLGIYRREELTELVRSAPPAEASIGHAA